MAPYGARDLESPQQTLVALMELNVMRFAGHCFQLSPFSFSHSINTYECLLCPVTCTRDLAWVLVVEDASDLMVWQLSLQKRTDTHTQKQMDDAPRATSNGSL